MKTVLFLVFVLNAIVPAYSQDEPIDTSQTHPFNKAVMLSAIVPGGGQIYNSIKKKKGFRHAIWKVPLIYGGLGATIYMLVQNQSIQKNLKTEYTNRINNETGSAEWAAYDDQGVLFLYQQYQDQRDLSILAVGAVYLFQILDAGVASHFISFDVSEDLSLRLRPTILGNTTPGINISLNFK